MRDWTQSLSEVSPQPPQITERTYFFSYYEVPVWKTFTLPNIIILWYPLSNNLVRNIVHPVVTLLRYLNFLTQFVEWLATLFFICVITKLMRHVKTTNTIFILGQSDFIVFEFSRCFFKSTFYITRGAVVWLGNVVTGVKIQSGHIFFSSANCNCTWKWAVCNNSASSRFLMYLLTIRG